jgi:hypothetical protein
MKMLHFERTDILDYEEQLSTKKKKRKSGMLSSLFKA